MRHIPNGFQLWTAGEIYFSKSDYRWEVSGDKGPIYIEDRRRSFGTMPACTLVVARRSEPKPKLTTEQKYDALVAGLKADSANPVSAQLLSDIGEA